MEKTTRLSNLKVGGYLPHFSLFPSSDCVAGNTQWWSLIYLSLMLVICDLISNLASQKHEGEALF